LADEVGGEGCNLVDIVRLYSAILVKFSKQERQGHTRDIGIWSVGKGPLEARLVKFIAVKTFQTMSKTSRPKERENILTNCHHGVVACIHIHRLIQREELRVGNNRRVHGRVEGGDGGLRQTSHKLLNIPNPLCTSSGIAWPTSVPEFEI